MTDHTNDTLNMTFSSIMRRKKEKVVHVRFERSGSKGVEYAEAVIPDCTFEQVYGFTEEELAQLKFYLQAHIHDIFEKAQKINDQEFWLK